MIGLLAEMFITGVVDKGGKIRRDLPRPVSGWATTAASTS